VSHILGTSHSVAAAVVDAVVRMIFPLLRTYPVNQKQKQNGTALAHIFARC